MGTRLTFCDEKVEHCQDDSVAREHVIAAGAHALNGHAEASPDVDRLLELQPRVSVGL